MKYLITGGAGFIGSHLAEKITLSGNTVYVYDDLSSGYLRNLPENNKIIINTSRVQDHSVSEFPLLDGIFHLGAQASVPLSIEKFYESSLNNLSSTLKVFELAKSQNIPLVYASSSAIYGNLPVGYEDKPDYEILSPYAQDKFTAEEYAALFYALYNISSIGLRFFNVYGPRQDPSNPYSGVISIFIDRFLKKEPVIINGGYQTRDFVYVEDVVEVLIKSMQIVSQNKICEFINVGTGISKSIDELFLALTKIFEYKPDVTYRPLPQGDPDKSSGNFNKLNKILKVDQGKFTELQQGLIQTINYFKVFNNEKI